MFSFSNPKISGELCFKYCLFITKGKNALGKQCRDVNPKKKKKEWAYLLAGIVGREKG